MSDSVGSKQAPELLASVQAFVNTRDVGTGQEDLRDPEGLRQWLVERALIEREDTVGECDLRLALDVREALRGMLLANNGGAPDRPALATLNRLARSAQLTLSFDVGGGARLEPRAPGVDGAFGRLLAAVFAAMRDGTWTRLKACAAERCRWAFYDCSRSRTGAWCSMAVCGNRSKAQHFRRRARAS
jgi:predicted RNA-binding Zn ribbon-like protein